MPEKGRRILVEFRRKDLEEIYYKNNQANIFLSPETQTHFLLTVISGLLSFVSIFYFSEMGRAWVLPFMFTGIFLVGFVSYITKMWPILKWRKQVSAYLYVLEKVKHFELVITEEALTDIQDEQLTIIKMGQL